MPTSLAIRIGIFSCLAASTLPAAAQTSRWDFDAGVSARAALAQAAALGIGRQPAGRPAPSPIRATVNNDYKITLDVEVTNSVAVYHGTGATSDAVAFKQVSGSRDKASRIRGEGPFAQLNSDKRETDKSVVGVDIKGESLLSVKKDNRGLPYLAVALTINDVIDGIKFNMATAYTADAEFTRGSWQDLENGLPVELKLTELGEKMAAEGATAAMQAAMRAMRDALNEKLQPLGGSAGQVRLDSFESGGRTTYSGTKSRLELRGGGKTTAAMSFVISAPF